MKTSLLSPLARHRGLLLVKRRKLAKDHEVHCLLVQDYAARTVSLTENIQRELAWIRASAFGERGRVPPGQVTRFQREERYQVLVLLFARG